MGVNLDTSKGRSQESGVRSQENRRKKKEGRSQESGVRSQENRRKKKEERRKKKEGRSQESGVRSQEERRKKKEENFSVPCSLFSDNSIEFNFVLYGFYQQPVVGLN
ncbi:MAG: hypothetical protein HEQ29_01485 [Dolichospermum sp. LBC05a]|nr:hypothetical protein [Dolichospermum sp. OL01]MCO5795527.1 hypothetical protein [Dolichospermum sp. OL03]MCS6280214.1 hypothetical protein [Dolichospermum sp.]QSV57229.1 MAG: hypothetical protein HEQ29_01485 [Dolichospermum sp. LBC05a]